MPAQPRLATPRRGLSGRQAGTAAAVGARTCAPKMPRSMPTSSSLSCCLMAAAAAAAAGASAGVPPCCAKVATRRRRRACSQIHPAARGGRGGADRMGAIRAMLTCPATGCRQPTGQNAGEQVQEVWLAAGPVEAALWPARTCILVSRQPGPQWQAKNVSSIRHVMMDRERKQQRTPIRAPQLPTRALPAAVACCDVALLRLSLSCSLPWIASIERPQGSVLLFFLLSRLPPPASCAAPGPVQRDGTHLLAARNARMHHSMLPCQRTASSAGAACSSARPFVSAAR
jgi:hypothetical protein